MRWTPSGKQLQKKKRKKSENKNISFADILVLNRSYGTTAEDEFLQPRRQRFQKLRDGKRDQLLDRIDYEQMLQSVEDAVRSNSQIAMGIFQTGCSALAQLTGELGPPETWRAKATAEDLSISRACIRGLLRDWSREGEPERNAAHGPILRALRQEFGHVGGKTLVRILVPGAGLGRLLHSISNLGLSVEGADVSYHTLLTCLYLFGANSPPCRHTLYPWALSFSNHVSRHHQLRGVMMPDLHLPGPVGVGMDMSQATGGTEQQIVFVRGGFVETYQASSQAGKFSALVTCYFIDTAPNFLDYVETAWNCLEPGGIWINIGPLLWNVEENGPAGKGEGDLDEQEAWKARAGAEEQTPVPAALELTGDEVLQLLGAKGFTVEQSEKSGKPSTYVGNPSSMLRYIYDMAFWVARKPRRTVKL